MKVILIIWVLSMFYPLNYNPEIPKIQSDVKFFIINYENMVKNKQSIYLSQIASSVEYIQLETTKDCLIGPEPNYYFTDSLIFVVQLDAVFKFSIRGKFLGKVASVGRGPNEIAGNILSICLIPEKKLFVAQDYSRHRLLFFSYEGKVIKTLNYSPYISRINVLRDGKFITYNSGSSGNVDYIFRLTNVQNDTFSVIKNYYNWKNKSPISVELWRPFEPFYLYQKRTYLKSLYNDTVYYVSSDKIIPAYYIDLGIHKLPNNFVYPERLSGTDLQLYREKAEKFNYVNIFQASNLIFCKSYSFDKNIPEKYFIYDITKKTGNYLINNNKISTGLINDWDGGPDFKPMGAVNDFKIFMPITALFFQKYFYDYKRNNTVKFQEEKIRLQKLVQTLDIMDNPILMIVTL